MTESPSWAKNDSSLVAKAVVWFCDSAQHLSDVLSHEGLGTAWKTLRCAQARIDENGSVRERKPTTIILATSLLNAQVLQLQTVNATRHFA